MFFRLGDFYELFNEDAIIGSRALEITLTARQKDSANPIPMCGVPHHAAANYIARLIKKGFRVAICEQTEDASKGKKLVRREVVRVITPGTAVDPQLVESKDSIYLASLCGAGESFGAAFLDISTGEFHATSVSGSNAWSKICSDIESFAPREMLFPEFLKKLVENTFGAVDENLLPIGSENMINLPSSPITLTAVDDWYYQTEDCENLLKKQFSVKELSAYAVTGKSEAIRSAGACLRYAHETQKAAAEHISGLNYFEASDSLVLDALTLRNLEVIEARGESNNRSLFGVIDETVTGMGARLLKSWLMRPLNKRSEIQTRLAAVSELSDTILRDKLRFLLKEVSDLERLVGRLSLGTISPRDLIALNRTLSQTPNINLVLSDSKSLLLQVLSENIFELPEVRNLISTAISDEPPLNIADGGVIREGFSAELDELRQVSTSVKQIIAGFEARERERTGIQNLKIKFNNAFGYFIEISKGNLNKTPEDYERRQTLTNAERFTTPQLKEWEQKVLGAEGRIQELEQELFAQVRSEISKEVKRLQSTARALATLDSLQGLAETAARRNYACPVLHDGDEVKIKNGRHPIVEAFSRETFIPNDLYMNNSTDRMLIITGPNMGGKSTVLRQTALIQILAQIGSFVPATAAELPILDRIWTRVGASDDLSSGRSTFMVEMTETAAILHNATPRSLILLDEIGRGTSTFDGLSIAWAVAEYLHDSPEHSAKTMFATHYHELTELAEKLAGAKNYQITATEKEGEVVFLHKLEKGKASKSYGIAVAQLAGLPLRAITRAKEVLERLERYELAVFAEEETAAAAVADPLSKAAGQAVRGKIASQISLFDAANEKVVDELKAIDADKITSDQAKQILSEIKKKLV